MAEDPPEHVLRKLVEKYGLVVPPEEIAEAFNISIKELENIEFLAKRKIRHALMSDPYISAHYPIILDNIITEK